jgi:HK97 family phage portal protein
MGILATWKENRINRRLFREANVSFRAPNGAHVAVVKAVDLERVFGFGRNESNINHIIGKLPSGYIDFAEAYTHHPTTRACFDKRATSAADVIVKSMFYKFTDNPYTDEKTIVSTPFVKCFRYIKPGSAPRRFFEKTFHYLDLDGNAYWYFEKQKGDVPYYIHSLRPDRVTLATNDSGKVVGYVYTVNNVDMPLAADQVIHFKRFNPLNDHYGLGLAVALAMTIESSFFQKNWNRKFFKNSARPDLVLTTKGTLPEGSFKRLKEAWKKQFKGVNNHHDVAVIEGGGDVKILNPTQKDLDFYKGIEADQDEIMGTTGVPPTVLGYPQANYATAKESKVTFWLGTILPIVNEIWDTFNASDIAYVEGVMASADITKSMHLMDALMTRAANYQQLVGGAAVAKVDEVRTAIGLPPADGGDRLYAPAGIQPLEMAGTYPGSTPVDDDDDDDDGGEEEEPKALLPPAVKKKDIDERHKSRHARWKVLNDKSIEEEEDFAEVLAPIFADQRDRVVKNLKANYSDPDKAYSSKDSDDDYDEFIDELMDDIFNLKEEAAYLSDDIISEARLEIIREHGQEGIEEVGEDAVFDEADPAVLEFLEQKEVKFASEVNGTTRESLRYHLLDGVKKGESVNELADRVRDVFSGVDDARAWRARTIARTEVVGAANKGQLEGWSQADVGAQKEWVTAGDADVRDEHAAIDGEIKKLNEPFSNGLMYPGDVNGPAEEVVNCRCTTAPVV